MFSGGKNSSELYVADLKFTGHKASAVILPAVCQCKVYCNDNFSGVHVRSAVGDTAGAPKENSGSGFQRDRGVVLFAQTNHKTKLKEGDIYKLRGPETKHNTKHFRKTCNTKKKKVEKNESVR